MKRLYIWFLSRWRWLVIAAGVLGLAALIWLLWFFQLKRLAGLIFVIVWLVNFGLGLGAGYAALRLWYSRHQPLIWRLGLYINAFIIDTVGAVVLLFVARGVVLTWKFSTVLFVSTFLSDLARAPLIFYIIKGPTAVPVPVVSEKSGDRMLEEIRKIVREEIQAQLVPGERETNH